MEKFMAFALEKSSVIGLHEDHLRLNDPNCTLYSNGTHVLANMSLTTCGTMMEVRNSELKSLLYHRLNDS